MSAQASQITEQVQTFTDVGALFAQTFDRLAGTRWRWHEILQAVVQIGIASLPIIVISTAFAGMVVTNEIAWHMDQALNNTVMMPGVTGQFILRELGIAIPALLLVAKVGAGMTAEVGTMRVTEQIDALKLLKIDPVNYLVAPRFVACIISSVCLTLIATAVTLLCAVGMAVSRYHFTVLEYVNSLRHFIGFPDFFCAITKGVIFGAVIPIISCAYGFRCKGGAEGVGTATTNSVVASTIVIIILDFILTWFFSLFL